MCELVQAAYIFQSVSYTAQQVCYAVQQVDCKWSAAADLWLQTIIIISWDLWYDQCHLALMKWSLEESWTQE